jgi:hypothetical protein
MSIKKNFNVSPEELTPSLVGPITVTLHEPLLQDVNTYRKISKFLSEFPSGTPSHSLEALLQEQLSAIKGIAFFLTGLAEGEAATTVG